MLNNPHQPPRPPVSPAGLSRPRSTLAYLVTSAVLGSLAGTAAVFAFAHFWVAPLWGRPIYKGDERWETLFFIAATLLPVSALVGTAIASVILRYSSLRLRHRGVIASCLAIMLFTWSTKPMISRIRSPDYPTPRFEWMPDLMCAVAAGALAATLLSALVRLICSGKGPRS